MALEDVKKYYASFDEWARLERPMGRLEFERALGFLDRFMPQPCRVLDLGTGPGRYAVELAKRGHCMTLADLSAPQLEIARGKIAEAGLTCSVEGFHELNATDMACFEAESFDAVVAFGPFYHLIAREDRQQAAGEIARVIRPGGLAFVAFIPPFFIYPISSCAPCPLPNKCAKRTLPKCSRRASSSIVTARAFKKGYFARPSEMEKLLAGVGLPCQLIASLRGIANGYEAELFSIAERDPELFNAIMDIVERTSTMASVIEMAGHAVAVARKTMGYLPDRGVDFNPHVP